uniref:Transmembrane protein 65 n=1 Tax=Culex pipiens TaxID=7175 RepID=A0A8D8B619_CULPI
MNTSVSAMSRVSCLVVQQCSRNVPGVAACSVSSGGNRIPAGRSFSSGSSTSTGYLFKVNGHRRFPAVQIVSSRGYTQAASTLTREQLHDLVYRLNEDERELLMNTLKQFESNKQKAQFEGQLAATVWRSRFGRPARLKPSLGDVDPTGSYCAVPEDWLQKKFAEAEPTPPTGDLMKLGLVNALPFIGFGFLDNFTMIIAGDYIEHTLGLFMCISTMAAAALGNTISDVIGIGSAFYVEKLAEMSGVRPPKLTPIQLEMKASRRAANLGRVWGITIGCLLGMCPLLFMKDEEKGDKKKGDKKDNGEDANSQITPEQLVVLEGSSSSK